MKKDKLGMLFLLAWLFWSGKTAWSQSQQSASVETLQTLIHKKSGLFMPLPDWGWQWEEPGVQGTPESGQISFSDQKWLMYLIHWGPIQEQTITVKYVRQRLVNMWGVHFEFSGKEGETNMNGHPAVYVEAYGPQRTFYTRFIVWNCPQSGREFIADTNYNLADKTPEVDFLDEWRSAQTIRCHATVPVSSFEGMVEEPAASKYGFAFSHPQQWFFQDSPYYVPFPQYEGIRSAHLGSLLGLCSDQNITVILKWSSASPEAPVVIMLGVDQKAAARLDNQVASLPELKSKETIGSENFRVDSCSVSRIWGSYAFEPSKEESGKGTMNNGIFQAAEWIPPHTQKRVTMILLTRTYRFAGATSAPGRNQQDQFLRDMIARIVGG